MLKTEKISVAEAVPWLLKSVLFFSWPYQSYKYKEKFLLERTKVCQVNRPLPKKENRWTAQKCEVLTFCSLGIEFQILPQSRKVNLPSAYVKLT